MIPAAFAYHRASSVEDASRLLAQGGADAKVLAGGHSLIPLMRLRLAQPSALIDINGLERDLSYVRRDNGTLRVGALTRHYQLAESDEVKRSLPLLAEIANEVGDAQVRSMGTMGGVLAHADPAGDYGTLALMLDAVVTTNRRSIPARQFFLGLFTTPLAADELVTEVAFPVAAGPHKYVKFRRRLCDWAIVGAGAQKMDDGSWRVGVTNAAPTPVRAVGVEQALAQGASPAEAARQATQGLDPASDLRGSAEYKRHLATVLTQRAVEGAR
ncbi:MAG TPA: xanthine dehydrogenase family protein subunit M [Chloroflexota bacterium]|nr:xanthine dehydrogenase family protein subunit M [Chloroflexota bacterium]